MATDRQFAFGPFRLCARTGRLWRGGNEVKLTPRAAAVLHLLAERSQDVVTKEELFERVWHGIAVSDHALTSCIKELRTAVGDDARKPSIIETRHRRGYRLMLPATLIIDVSEPQIGETISERSQFVGRLGELHELGRRLDLARKGARQTIFISGEPGIGKSSLADIFLVRMQQGAEADQAVRIGQGQCVDQHGAGEPYLPVIEALTRLAKSRGGAEVRAILKKQAPSWVTQFPSLGDDSDDREPRMRGSATRERMMRELTLAIEDIAADTPLVLRLEDIHWSDASTLDWIGHVARRPEPARLLLLATLRPGDAAAINSRLGDLVSELALHGWCREIALDPLTLKDIETYLGVRLGQQNDADRLRELAPAVLERTGGNPLFMTSMITRLVHQGSRDETSAAILSVPNDVRRFIDRQIDDLGERDRELLAAASVVGREFAAPLVAAALGVDVEQIETRCAGLVRQGVFIGRSDATTWPDGTLVELYSFRHDLFREVLYERLSSTRRAANHLCVGSRLERAWANTPDVVAAELAQHFENGGERARALPHHQRAAATALRRSANQEAIGHFERALSALSHVTDEAERIKLEIDLRVGIGAAFMATRGFAAPEVLEAYTRAEELCDRLGERPDIFPAIWGQWAFRHGRGEFGHARRLCARLLALAEKSNSSILKLHAHHAIWPTLFSCGEFKAALAHVEIGLALYDTAIHQITASSYGKHDAYTCACSFGAVSLALLGDSERARAMIDDAVVLAETLKDPFSLALTRYFASATGQLLDDVEMATANAEASLRVSTEHGFALTKAWSAGVAGWCAVRNGNQAHGFGMLAEAIGTLRRMRSMAYMSYLLGLLADSEMRAGLQPQAIVAVDDAIGTANATGERFYVAELYRLRGELLAHPSVSQHEAAADAFRTAIKIAREQASHSLELKAVASLGECIG